VSAFDRANNCYILCVRPTDTEVVGYTKYTLDITVEGYKKGQIVVSGVRAGVSQCFKVNPKNVPTKETVKTVYVTRKNALKKWADDFDWTKDLKMIFGLSNGIVASEIFGFYGELKFGEKTGFALEGVYCPGFDDITYDERWSVGVKALYKNFFLSTHYGTTMSVGNKNSAFSMNDDGTFILAGSRPNGRYGVTELTGYDRTFKWFHLTVGIGRTVTTTTKPKFLPAWNVGIGVSLMDLIK
jgi:hypothetical protein